MLVEPVVREEKSASGKPNGSAGVDSTTRTNGTTKLYEPDIGTRGAPALVKSSQKSYAASHPSSPLTIFLNSFHLLTSLRGFGYAFGPPSHHRHPRKHSLHFLRSALASLAISHLISITCLALIIHRHSAVPSLLSHLSLPLRALQPTANVLSYLAVGVSLHAQMETGFAMASIAFVVGTAILRALLPPAFRPAPFDSREFPPLFDTPYKPKSVTKFWSAQWHALFRFVSSPPFLAARLTVRRRKPFLSVGYDPVTRLVSRALGKHAGRAIGAFTVFALSAWMHDQALCSARHLLPAGPPLSFSLRYGGWIFFLSQGVAVFLEGVFTRLTGRRVRGGVGLAWSYFCIVGLGLLAGRSWCVPFLSIFCRGADELSRRIALGLVEGLPEVQRWGWQRFVVPSAALAPPPLWMV